MLGDFVIAETIPDSQNQDSQASDDSSGSGMRRAQTYNAGPVNRVVANAMTHSGSVRVTREHLPMPRPVRAVNNQYAMM